MLATGFTFPKKGILIGIQVIPKTEVEEGLTEELINCCLVFVHTSVNVFLCNLSGSALRQRNKHNREIFTGAGPVFFLLSAGSFYWELQESAEGRTLRLLQAEASES